MTETPSKFEKRLLKISGTEPSADPVHLTEDEATGDRFLIYSDDKGLKVELRFAGDSLWMNQAQMAGLFGVSVPTISRHVSNIFDDGELDENATVAKIATVRNEGERQVSREIEHYNLDMVISVGYRVSSAQATLFRKWATGILVQFATKGYVVDVERLSAPGERDHFRELREIIRTIRASEANVYRELRDIISLCSDYAALNEAQKNRFFATVQNKLLFAVTGMTAPELRLTRAKAGTPNMGLTTWKNREIRKSDIKVAKNYLGDAEIRDLNRFTNMLLDYFEQETDLLRLVSTSDAEAAVDRFIRNNDRPLLVGAGNVSKEAADSHCAAEFDKFDDLRKKRYLEADQEDDI